MPTRKRERRNSGGPDPPIDSDQAVRARGNKNPSAPNAASVSPSGPRSPSSPPFPLLLLLSAAVLLIPAGFFIFRYVHRVSVANSSPNLSVYERGLVRPNVVVEEILSENARVSTNRSLRHFPNPVLAYITPWNSRGYEIAKLFSSKLTHISPVWYQLKSEGKNLVLQGWHNADTEWISEIRMLGSSLVLPRVVIETSPTELLLKKKQRAKAINAIVTECKDMGYDGIVLESWLTWAAYGVLHDPDLRNMALAFINELGQALHLVNSVGNAGNKLELIYVIPPPRSEKLTVYDFGPQDLKQLDEAVDGFSLMSYDFSGPQNPGPNAPLNWIRSSLNMLLEPGTHEARKIFLGINYYGYDFKISEGPAAGAITGRDYVSLLEKHKPTIHWEEKSAEHYFVYSDKNAKHAVFYPSLMSLSVRIEEARAWGAGLSIWEIGQGLDYFFDLL